MFGNIFEGLFGKKEEPTVGTEQIIEPPVTETEPESEMDRPPAVETEPESEEDRPTRD